MASSRMMKFRGLLMVVATCSRHSASREASTRSSALIVCTWEEQVLSARGFKRVGRHSEYAI